jgi:hypothetical protein
MLTKYNVSEIGLSYHFVIDYIGVTSKVLIEGGWCNRTAAVCKYYVLEFRDYTTYV